MGHEPRRTDPQAPPRARPEAFTCQDSPTRLEQCCRGARLVGDRFYEMTLGAQIKPYDWLWIRPEARYDWTQFHPAYSNDTRKSQLTLAFDVIVLF